jgi:hypothetical protein
MSFLAKFSRWERKVRGMDKSEKDNTLYKPHRMGVLIKLRFRR